MNSGLNRAQQGVWLGHTMSGNPALFNTAECIQFSGKIDQALLRQAISQGVQESECAYSFYRAGEDNVPYRVQGAGAVQIDVAEMPETDAPREFFRHYALQVTQVAVDISTTLPIRFVIFTAPQQDYLFSTSHHISLDGYGNTLLFRRIAQIYTALCSAQEVAPCDFTPMQALLEEENSSAFIAQYQAAKQYWNEQFDIYPDAVSFAQGKGGLSGQYLRQSNALSAQHWQQMITLAEQHKVAWPDLFIATLATLLFSYTGQTKLTFGLIVMNRIGSKALNIPCMQTNIVPLFVDIDAEDSLLSLAKQIGKRKRLMRKHQLYRYEDLKRDRNKVALSERLYGPMINIMPFDHPAKYGQLESSTLNLSAGNVDDLIVQIYLRPDGPPEFDFDANPASYDSAALVTLRDQLLALVSRCLNAPEQTLLSICETHLSTLRAQALLCGPTVTQARDLITTILSHGVQTPNAPAIRQDNVEWSYQTLITNAERIAAYLQQQGLVDGARIGVCMKRQPLQVASLLAIIAVGATFVPLDVEQPLARQQQIVATAELSALICDAQSAESCQHLATPIHLLGALMGDKRCALRAPLASSSSYIMFTSGSTGQPKGVPVSYGALTHFSQAAQQTYGVTATDKVMQFAPLHFDASMEEIFVTLLAGAELVLRNEAMLQSVAAFVAFLAERQVSVVDLPTAFWSEWALTLDLPSHRVPESVRVVIIGGEAVYAEQLSQWQRYAPSQVRLFNTYGPTEATVVACCADITQVRADTLLPIGQPLPGEAALVVADNLRPAAEGELLLLGPNLSHGYLGATSAQQRAFIELNVGSEQHRAYRTGDKVKRIGEQLVYLGRMDDEFKISGYRVQPGEVEAKLLALADVNEACVQGVEEQVGVRRLVAFIASANTDLDIAHIRAALLEQLPRAMVPTDYRCFLHLPKTRNGKVDRKKLLAMYQDEATGTELESDTERAVAAIWRQILGVSQIQPHDNFFQLGGQSLHTIQIVNRLGKEFGVSLKVSDAFNNPTLSEFCAFLDEQLCAEPDVVEMVW
ncbi:amino acid adenylation domain-containing protein [Pseudoalteromonas fenneropenaei]|uniref:Amino acid adenylation domain-containing protein n=1 Tax=Pseudoalteromonas fenneropenaei TaxID=1737459 RepID=A0ABV7CPV9_9GAMM